MSMTPWTRRPSRCWPDSWSHYKI